jgi:O-antigen/teichoic acid export membrane protein
MDVATLTANSSTMALIATTVGVVIISILWSMGWTEALVPGVPIGLVWLAAIGLPLGLLSGYFSAILQGLQQITTINAVNLSQMGLTLVLTLLFVVEFDLGVVGALVATLGGGVFAIAGMSYFLKRQGGSFALKWDSPIIHRTLSFGLRGHIGNMLQFINYRLDMFFVNYFLGPAGVGIYSVSVGIAELLWYLPNAIGFIVFPKAASTQPEVMNVFIPRIFSIALGLTALGAFGLIFFGKQIIHLLFSSSFNSAYFPLVALLPGAVLLGGAKILSNDIAGRGYPHYNSINSGVAAILTIILDLMLIPSYGVLGAALASSVAYGVIFLIALCFHRVVSRRTKGVLFA